MTTRKFNEAEANAIRRAFYDGCPMGYLVQRWDTTYGTIKKVLDYMGPYRNDPEL